MMATDPGDRPPDAAAVARQINALDAIDLLDKNVRVTYTGANADAIDQLSPDKKKKKKA